MAYRQKHITSNKMQFKKQIWRASSRHRSTWLQLMEEEPMTEMGRKRCQIRHPDSGTSPSPMVWAHQRSMLLACTLRHPQASAHLSPYITRRRQRRERLVTQEAPKAVAQPNSRFHSAPSLCSPRMATRFAMRSQAESSPTQRGTSTRRWKTN